MDEFGVAAAPFHKILRRKWWYYPNSAFTVGFLAASLGDQGGLWQRRSGSAFTLKCCKTHTIVTPTPNKPKRNCISFCFCCKTQWIWNIFCPRCPWSPHGRPSSQRFPQTAPRRLPDASYQMSPPRCLLPESKKNTVWVLVLGLFNQILWKHRE